MASTSMTTLRFLTLPFSLMLLACSPVPQNPVVAQDSGETSESDETFGIASKAPAIDIEHWIQDGGGKFKPVKKFKDGQVYVVEFWATWCGPCIQSMPHLAELQQKYGDEVRLISVTDETLDEVDALLQQTYPQTEKTFNEVTQHYSLTSDPDGSTHEDYMQAAEIGGIPSAFLVGKTGLIEWIGHPMLLDAPLEAVLNDNWDRDAEKIKRLRQKQREKITREMAMLARQGRYDDALELVTKQAAETPADQLEEKEYWISVVNSLKMSAGKLDQEAIDYYQGKIAEMDGDFNSLTRFAFSLFEHFDGGSDVGPLAKNTDDALSKVQDKVEPGAEPLYHYARALLNRIDDDFDGAIDQFSKAVDVATGKQKERFAEALETVKEEAKELAAKKKGGDGKDQK